MFYYQLVAKYAIIYVQEYVLQQVLMCQVLSAPVTTVVIPYNVYSLHYQNIAIHLHSCFSVFNGARGSYKNNFF